MSKAINKIFNLKQGEETLFLLLFSHTFVLGLFTSLFYARATAEFVQNVLKPLGNQYMPIAYILSGIMGYLTSVGYRGLQKKTTIRILLLITNSFIFVVPLLLRLCATFINVKAISLLIYIFAAPMMALAILETGALTIRLLNLQQSKRLIGLIGIGNTIASLIGFIGGPFLTALFSTKLNIIFVAISGPALAFLILGKIFKLYPQQISAIKANVSKGKSNKQTSVFRDKYFSLLVFTAIFSTILVYFTAFNYTATIKVQPEINQSKEQLDSFISFFLGATKLGEFILSYFSGRIISRLGVKFGLIVLPASLLATVSMAAIAGLFIQGAGIILFILIVLSRYVERIMRRSLENPSFRTLFQPLPDEQKFDIQSRIDGVIKQIAVGFAGVLLFACTYIFTYDGVFITRYFQWAIIPVVVLWFISTKRLYEHYKKKLQQILKERGRQNKRDSIHEIYGNDLLVKQIKEKNNKTLQTSVQLLSETNSADIEPYSLNLLKSGNKYVVNSVLKVVDPVYLFLKSDYIQQLYLEIQKIARTANNTELKELTEKALINTDYTKIRELPDTMIDAILNITTHEDKIELIKSLNTKQSAIEEQLIVVLINDENPLIKKAALKLIGKKKLTTLKDYLIEYLRDAGYFYVCRNSILQLGNEILPELELLFKREISRLIQLRIVEILARVGTDEAKKILIGNLNYPDREIQIAIVKALYYSKYYVNEQDRLTIKNLLEDSVNHVLWLYACELDLEAEKSTLKLLQAIETEREQVFDLLFCLLSFLYDHSAVELIRQNMIGEQYVFTLEIIDNLVEQDIKELIFPLFDNISPTAQLKKLQSFFPQQRLTVESRLKDIINKDYNRVSTWTKLRAIELLSKIYSNTLPNELIASLYHPNELISTTTAKTLQKRDFERSFYYCKKSPVFNNDFIEALKRNKEIPGLLAEKVKMLRRIPAFIATPEDVLEKMAKISEVRLLSKDQKIFFTVKRHEYVIVLIKGKLSYTTENKEKPVSRFEFIVPGTSVPHDVSCLTATKDCQVICIIKADYFNILVDEIELTKIVLEIL